MIGLTSALRSTLAHGLEVNGVGHAPRTDRADAADLGPLAAFVGCNPIQHLVGAGVLHALPAHAQATLTGHGFFPRLISKPFSDGLDTAFGFAIVACLIAAAASLLRGGRYHHADEPERAPGQIPQLEGQHAR